MFDVNLYVEVSGQGKIKKCKRNYCYVLEFELKDGSPFTRDGAGCGEEVSAWKIALMAVTEAVGRISRPSEIHLYTGCPELYDTAWKDWLRGWKENGFLTAKGTPVKNHELWARLGDMLENHFINVEGTEHPYKKWMLSELEREERSMGTGKVSQAGDELERARREAWSLDPDRWKWPPGLKRLGAEVKETRGNKCLYTYYRDDGAENADFRYRYDSRPYQEPPEVGWGRR